MDEEQTKALNEDNLDSIKKEEFTEETIEFANEIIAKGFFNCGFYQCLSFLLISISWTVGNGWYAFVSVFSAYTPEHTCAHTSLNNTDKCLYFNESQGNFEKCTKWNYDDSQMKTTIITEYGFFCDKNYYFEVSYSIEQSGYLIGALLFSFIADRFGRKLVLCLCLLSMSSIGFVQYFVKNFYIYMSFGFVMNMFASGLDSVTVPLVIEIFTKKKRTIFGIGMEYVWVLVLACLAPLAYLIKTWRELRGFIFIALGLLGLSSLWLVQESLTWLISCKNFTEANRVLNRIAKFNRLDKKEFEQDKEKLKLMFNKIERIDNNLIENDKSLSQIKTILIDIFKYKKFSLFSLILIISWYVTGLIYDGLTYLNSSIGENIFLNWLLSSLVEFPGQILCHYTVSKYGRVTVASLSLISSGVFLFCSLLDLIKIFENLWWLKLGVFMMAKFSITISYSTIILHTSELFPTYMRSFGYGFCLFSSKLSSIVSPIISLYLVN